VKKFKLLGADFLDEEQAVKQFVGNVPYKKKKIRNIG
jgi:hypothetical protein